MMMSQHVSEASSVSFSRAEFHLKLGFLKSALGPPVYLDWCVSHRDGRDELIMSRL
uniref:Uncharacterized protein n=1 Tax=Anguilla anguilla TaxID=7936 RepID=A0A0E9U8Q6_ANGAN